MLGGVCVVGWLVLLVCVCCCCFLLGWVGWFVCCCFLGGFWGGFFLGGGGCFVLFASFVLQNHLSRILSLEYRADETSIRFIRRKSLNSIPNSIQMYLWFGLGLFVVVVGLFWFFGGVFCVGFLWVFLFVCLFVRLFEVAKVGFFPFNTDQTMYNKYGIHLTKVSTACQIPYKSIDNSRR